MEITVKTTGGVSVAVVRDGGLLLRDAGSALDLLGTVKYESGCDRVALRKESVTEDFFILSTGVAGEILQKFVNYHAKLAIIGDFSKYTSKPLRDFMYESNRGRDIFFVPTEAEALQMLGRA